ncbi:hypothetical protein SELMODRAFT_404845 [Selaginella moellendorffii]|uniref:Glutamine amidotransferase domain-containing protein n=1 Tax=Selaginella moellendorffii TaxID=88036 RepID=D8QXJ4_SELML|nr:hypothetical protein SELMODRAFT_404845 [Selaginella moellendorffii]
MSKWSKVADSSSAPLRRAWVQIPLLTSILFTFIRNKGEASCKAVPRLGVHRPTVCGILDASERNQRTLLEFGKHMDQINVTTFVGLTVSCNCTNAFIALVNLKARSDELEITAWTEDGLIMGMRHSKYKHVQFHPEGIISQNGKQILENYIRFVNLQESRGPFLAGTRGGGGGA